MQKKSRNIWSVQKKAVPLHPLSPREGFEWKAKEFFERLSIIQDVVQESTQVLKGKGYKKL